MKEYSWYLLCAFAIGCGSGWGTEPCADDPSEERAVHKGTHHCQCPKDGNDPKFNNPKNFCSHTCSSDTNPGGKCPNKAEETAVTCFTPNAPLVGTSLCTDATGGSSSGGSTSSGGSSGGGAGGASSVPVLVVAGVTAVTKTGSAQPCCGENLTIKWTYLNIGNAAYTATSPAFSPHLVVTDSNNGYLLNKEKPYPSLGVNGSQDQLYPDPNNTDDKPFSVNTSTLYCSNSGTFTVMVTATPLIQGSDTFPGTVSAGCGLAPDPGCDELWGYCTSCSL